MFVPFDRLYDFLDQLVDNDVVIYRFYPHGSRKFSDISMLKFYPNYPNPQRILGTVPIMMHDQEPLDFDFYNNIDPKEILHIIQKNRPERINELQQQGVLDRVIEIQRSNNLDIFYGRHIADRWLLCHSEKNSSQLLRYQFLGAIGIYWWSHAMIAKDWYRYAQIDQQLNCTSMNFEKDFNVYNRAWAGTREYRLKFAEMIVKNNLLPSTSIKISAEENGVHYSDHIFRNSKFDIDIDLSILEPNHYGSTASADYSYEDYQRSAIDVVLETMFDDSRLHLTEKTLRPIACGKPFIMVSTPGSLKYLRDYGFETFGDYIDESYDIIADPFERLLSIIKSMKKISDLSKSDKNILYQQLHEIAQRNKKWFWSDNFTQHVINEFKENYQQAYAICKQSQNGEKILKLWEQFKSVSPKSRQDMIDMIAKVKSQSLSNYSSIPVFI
jgi:hypothetical protein